MVLILLILVCRKTFCLPPFLNALYILFLKDHFHFIFQYIHAHVKQKQHAIMVGGVICCLKISGKIEYTQATLSITCELYFCRPLWRKWTLQMLNNCILYQHKQLLDDSERYMWMWLFCLVRSVFFMPCRKRFQRLRHWIEFFYFAEESVGPVFYLFYASFR